MIKHSRARKRSRDHRVSILLYDVTRTVNTVVGSPPTSGTYPHSASAVVGENSVMSDVVTSNFFDLINQKYDVSNACSRTSSNELYEGRSDAYFSFSGFSTQDHSKAATASISWEGEGILGVSQPIHSLQPPSYILADINDAKLYTLQQAYARASSASFNGSLFGAEALKTARMLVKPMRSAISLVRRIKSKRKKLLAAGSSPAKALTGSWLEYRYGWKPFMNDISDLVDALYKSPRIPHEDLVARAGYDRTYNDSVPWVNPIQPGDISFGGTTFIDWQARVRSSVRYRIEDDSYPTFLTQSLGLGLDTLPATIWELVPFSFVADWFMGFGQWLDTIIPKPYIKILSNSSSVRSTRRIIDKMEYIEVDSLGRGVWPQQVKRQHVGRQFTGVYYSYDRSVNEPIPLVPLRTPGTLNLVHSVDSVALLHQIFLGELRSLKKF